MPQPQENDNLYSHLPNSKLAHTILAAIDDADAFVCRPRQRRWVPAGFGRIRANHISSCSHTSPAIPSRGRYVEWFATSYIVNSKAANPRTVEPPDRSISAWP